MATTAQFTINVGEGSVTILSPTAEQGTTDPAVPAFPDVVDYVNPLGIVVSDAGKAWLGM